MNKIAVLIPLSMLLSACAMTERSEPPAPIVEAPRSAPAPEPETPQPAAEPAPEPTQVYAYTPPEEMDAEQETPAESDRSAAAASESPAEPASAPEKQPATAQQAPEPAAAEPPRPPEPAAPQTAQPESAAQPSAPSQAQAPAPPPAQASSPAAQEPSPPAPPAPEVATASPSGMAPTNLPPAVDSLARRAEQQRQAADYTGAAATLERALRIQPQEAFLWNRLARVRLEQGQSASAGSLAARSNALSGDRPQLKQNNWEIIATVRRQSGDMAGALEAERKAAGG